MPFVEHNIRKDQQGNRVICYREDKLNGELMAEPINGKNSVTEMEERIHERSLVGKEQECGNMSLSQIDSSVLEVLTSVLSDKNLFSGFNA